MPSGKLLAWIVVISALTCLGLQHYQARKG